MGKENASPDFSGTGTGLKVVLLGPVTLRPGFFSIGLGIPSLQRFTSERATLGTSTEVEAASTTQNLHRQNLATLSSENAVSHTSSCLRLNDLRHVFSPVKGERTSAPEWDTAHPGLREVENVRHFPDD